jgi:signal transduction histidine kinase
MSKSLQQKNTRYLLVWLPLVMLIGSILFYVLMSAHAHHMAEEQLGLKQKNIRTALMTSRGLADTHITGEYDLVKGDPVRGHQLHKQRDTTLYYPADKAWVTFKILTEQFVITGQTYQLTTYISSKEIAHLIIKVFIAEIFVFVLLLIAIVVINQKSSGLLWRPFYATMKKVKEYDIVKDQSLQLTQQTGIAEFDQLNQVITRLIGNVTRAYSNQKQFVENASHEIQTPLAIIRSKLDLLINNPGLTEETAGLLADITEANDRLSQMNKNLLLLTKIDNNQFPDQSDIDLSNAIEKLLNWYQDYYEETPPRAERSIQPGVSVKANASLIDILINNLISNAFMHNIPHGYVHVLLNSRELIIENTGHPIEGETDQLFERFKKGRDQSKTTGLGLSLVRRICQIYQYRLNYSYKDNIHRVTVNF